MNDHNIRIQNCSWKPAIHAERSFVKHPSAGSSPGLYCILSCGRASILLSVVIPTCDADRNGYLASLLDQIICQTFLHFEVILIKGDPRQGRAINVGAALASGTYLLTLDDDTSLPDPETFSKLVHVMQARPDIGITGGNNVIPEDAPILIRRAMREIPRRSWQPVRDLTDSDLAEHPCLMMRTDEFKRIGGENELIPRGLDPYLREQFRKSGLRVVVAPGVIYHHLPPDTLGALLKQFYRNGRQAAYVNRYFPQWVIETPEHHGSFVKRVAFPRRFGRSGLRMLHALVTGKPLWFGCQLAYALGHLACRTTGERFLRTTESN